jgi:hypothetical protein
VAAEWKSRDNKKASQSMGANRTKMREGAGAKKMKQINILNIRGGRGPTPGGGRDSRRPMIRKF